MCKECGKAILSDSFSGDEVKLFLLNKGVVEQEMEGQYDSYGRVFDEDTGESIMWARPWSGFDRDTPKPPDGMSVCDLMFDDDSNSGIAAIHTQCFTGKIPTDPSEDDPNQGWGEEDE